MVDESPRQKDDEKIILEANYEETTFGHVANFQGVIFKGFANFKGATFKEGASFGGATFDGGVSFEGAKFDEGADFRGASFAWMAMFQSATFSGSEDYTTKIALFQGARFSNKAFFSNVKFIRGATFFLANFEEDANFEDAIFTEGSAFADAKFKNALFKGAAFGEGVNFDGANFRGIADFKSATFGKKAFFRRTIFIEQVRFRSAVFMERTKAAASFLNSDIKSETAFDNAMFLYRPPLFDGAKLHEGTTWFGVTWPGPPGTKADAQLFVRAYERLKLEMDKLKKHEDELKFFALELQARRVLAGKWLTFHGLAIGTYGGFCDYGQSYSRPLLLLGVVAALGAAPFLLHFGLPGWRGSLALSAANTFGVLGLRREFFPPSVIIDLPRMLKLLSMGQTLAGAILFFLFGLSLRNRFRMR